MGEENSDRKSARRRNSRRLRTPSGERTRRTVIRHTDDEWAHVTAEAERLGLSVPGYYLYAASELAKRPAPGEGVRDAEGAPVERPETRRRRNPGGTRPHQTVIRHNDAEWARVTAAAVSMGKSVPEFYTMAVWAGSAQAAVELGIIHDELWGVRRSLRNATNNINQIALGVNTDGTFYAEQATKAVQHLDATVERLNELLDPVEQHSPRGGAQ